MAFSSQTKSNDATNDRSCDPSSSKWQQRRKVWLTLASIGLAVFLLAVFLQKKSGAYESDFGAHSDEPAHVVTGLMVRDYLAEGLPKGEAPMAFAKTYYERYPKVALGHYPPAFYVVEGLWLLPVRSPEATLILMATLCAIATLLTWWLAKNHGIDTKVAILPALLLVIHPLVRTYTNIVMSDLLLVIFCLLATDAWRRFLGSEKKQHALWFGLWAAAAILTKGSGLFLALLPPLSLVLSRKIRLIKCRALWLAPLPVLAFALPWMLATRHITAEGMSSTPLADYIPQAANFFARNFPIEFGWLACGLLVIAVTEVLVRCVSSRPVSDSSACLISFVVGLLLLYLVVPAGLDSRYLLPLVPPVLILGFDLLYRSLNAWAAAKIRVAIVLVVLIIAAVTTHLEVRRPVKKILSGYAAAIDAIVAESPVPRSGDFNNVLIASGSNGEGAVIAAAAFRPEAKLKIHRGTKTLVETDWTGKSVKPLTTAGQETWQKLQDLEIDWILMDDLPDNTEIALISMSLPKDASSQLHPITTKAKNGRQLRRILMPDR